MVSEIFDASRWRPVEGFNFTDLTYHRAVDQGTVRIAFNRPECRNAFRPNTVDELYTALDHARMWSDVGTVLLTGNGPSPKEAAGRSAGRRPAHSREGWLQVRRRGGSRQGQARATPHPRGSAPHRTMPKVVICVVPGWAVGGGHSLHVVADLTLASEEHAVFKQTDADVASFDAGYGSAYLARQVGEAHERSSSWAGTTARKTPSRWAW